MEVKRKKARQIFRKTNIFYHYHMIKFMIIFVRYYQKFDVVSKKVSARSIH